MNAKILKPIALSCALLSSAAAQAIDLGIYYTSAFKAAYGNDIDSVRSAISSEIALANSALQQAGSSYSYNIIYMSESTITNVTATGAAGSLKTNSMSTSDVLNAGIDIQLVYYGANSGDCGAETHNGPGNDRDIATMSYASIRSSCMGEGTTAHELGHSHGMGHADGVGGITPYAKAAYCGGASTLVASAHSLSFYSDPSKSNNDEACGVDGETDNARMARERGSYLENHNNLRRAATVSIASSNIAANEDDNGATITANLTNPISDAAYVEVYVKNGSANASDYTWTTQRVSIPLGVTTFDFTIPLVNDSTPEAAETFTVGIRDGVGVSANDTAIVTIAESDNVEVVDGNVSFSESSITINEGESASVNLVRTGTTGDAVVSFTSASLSTLSATELTLSPGQTSPLSITIPQDDEAEGNRSFTVELSHPDPSVVGSTNLLTVNVIEDDSTGYIKIPDSALNSEVVIATEYHVEEGTSISVPLERVGGSIGSVTATTAWGGRGDADAVTYDGEVTFADGVTTGVLAVNIPDNGVVDGTRTVSIGISTGKEGEGIFSGGVYLIISDPTEPTEPTTPDPTEPTEPTTPDPTEPTEPTDPTTPDPTEPTEPTDPTVNSVSIKGGVNVDEGEEFEVTLELKNSDNTDVNATLSYLGESTEYKFSGSNKKIIVSLIAPKDSSTDDVQEIISLQGPDNLSSLSMTFVDTDLEGEVQFSDDSLNIDVEGSNTFKLTLERTEGQSGNIITIIENLEGEFDDVEVTIPNGSSSASHTYTASQEETKTYTFRLINSNTDIVAQKAATVTVVDDSDIGFVNFKVAEKSVAENEQIAIEIERVGGSSGRIYFELVGASASGNIFETIIMNDGESSKTVMLDAVNADNADVVFIYRLRNKNTSDHGDVLGDSVSMTITILDSNFGTIDNPFELTVEQEEGNASQVVGGDVSFTIARPERLFGDAEFTIYNEELGISVNVLMLAGEDSVDVSFDVPVMYLADDTNVSFGILGGNGNMAGNVEVTLKPLEEKALDTVFESTSVEQGENIVVVINRPDALVGELVFSVIVDALNINEDVILGADENVLTYELATNTVSPQTLTIIVEEKSIKQYGSSTDVVVNGEAVVTPVEPTKKESSGGSMGIFVLFLFGTLLARRK